MSRKHMDVHRLIRQLSLPERRWVLLDHWDGDQLAIGIAAASNRRRLVYVSIDPAQPDRYNYICEVPNGPEPTEFEHGRSDDNVSYDDLVAALEEHLT